MSAEPLRPLYLLAGSDRPKVTRALRRLRARFDDASVEHLYAAEASGEDAVAACNALGLFGAGGRLVVVDGVERWKAADAKAIGHYAGNPAPDTVVALVADDLKADAPLGKAVAVAGGAVLVWNVSKRRLPEWVAEQFGLAGVAADRDACEALVEIAGDDLEHLAREVEKLATWAAGEPVTARAVAALAVDDRDLPNWALADAWGSRDVAAVLRTCESDLSRSEPFVIAARLAGHVGTVRSVARLTDEGLSTRDAGRRLGVHEFRVRKARAHADAYSRDELDDAVVRLAALDAALKGASRRSSELELELALVDVTRRPAGRGAR